MNETREQGEGTVHSFREDENGIDVLELRQREDVGHFSERRFSRVESMDSDWGGLRVRAGKRRLCDDCKQNDRCLAPPRLKSAELSPEDLRKNYYPVGTTVSYVCRLAYESTGLRPVITCLENLTWAEAPEFCLGKSCGVPESPEHGRLVDATNNRFGAKVNIICDDGYKVSGRHFIQCLLNRDQVEWSKLPTCQSITCSPPPNITNGLHNGNHLESFDYNTSVTYKCDPNFSLTGEASIHCTTKDNINGVWNGSAPECKVISCSAPPNITNGMHNGNHLESFDYNTSVTYKCDPNFSLTGEASIHCTTKDNINGVWNGSAPECKVISCSAPPNITNGMHNGNHLESFDYNTSVTYKCDPNFSLTGEASIHCTTKDNINGVWNGSAPECKVIITQDKPTTVPPEGAEVAGTSSGIFPDKCETDVILLNNSSLSGVLQDLCQKEIPLQLRCERCSGITNSHNFPLGPASWYSVNKHCEEQP
ncbi:unnamed protein product [Caretta caretta]